MRDHFFVNKEKEKSQFCEKSQNFFTAQLNNIELIETLMNKSLTGATDQLRINDLYNLQVKLYNQAVHYT